MEPCSHTSIIPFTSCWCTHHGDEMAYDDGSSHGRRFSRRWSTVLPSHGTVAVEPGMVAASDLPCSSPRPAINGRRLSSRRPTVLPSHGTVGVDCGAGDGGGRRPPVLFPTSPGMPSNKLYP